MKISLDSHIAYLSDDLFNRGQNHVILFGDQENTRKVLEGMYQNVQEHDDYLCTFHEAAQIKSPLDFFESILQRKYGDEYASLKNKHFFEKLLNNFDIGAYCGKDLKEQRTPFICIDGIDSLFFNLDFPLGEVNTPLGFGDALRSYLQEDAVFYGTVHDPESFAYQKTLANPFYQFHINNFSTLIV